MKMYIFIFCGLLFFITKTFALENDILFFRYHNDVYQYDVASKNNFPSKLNNKYEKTEDIATSDKNTLYLISKNNGGGIKYKEDKKGKIRIRRLSLPDYSRQKAKIIVSPDGKFFVIVKNANRGRKIYFFKWKSNEPFFTINLDNGTKSTYCFSSNSKYFAWTEINSKTQNCSIKRIDILSKKITKLAEIKTSMGFSGSLLSVRLYWTKEVLWICSYPNPNTGTLSYAFLNSEKKLIKSNKKDFFVANNLSFKDTKGVWCYKNKRLHFLFGFNNFKGGAPTVCRISNSSDNIAVVTNKILYILTLKNNNIIKRFHKYMKEPTGKIVWNRN